MARTVRNHPVPRDKMQEERGAEQIPEVKTQEISVGLYIRLSKEDSGKHNQNTVENQKALLEDFVRSKADMKVFDVYIDNGFSGTNFERPAFQKMMEDAKSGKINCIIVKDLSRFGRSYLEIGNYLEKIFPFLNIRFISVTDHFDTFAAASSESGRPLTNGLEIPLKNIINEVYAKDISRKVGSAIEIKKKEGRYGGGVAPYGYRKSKTVKGKYEVDEEAAKVVRYIFGLRSEGYGYCSIVKILNEKEIKSPSAYRYEKGIVKNEKLRDVLWKAYAIEDMLRDEVYLGNMVRGKTHSAMHKGEKRHPVPREEWIVVPGMHKPIVSKELFDAVQAVNEKRAQEHKKKLEKAKENPKRDNVFKGKIFCGDCGITMGCSVGKHNSKSYYCTNYRENIIYDYDNVIVGKLLLGLMQYMQARKLVTDEKNEIFQKCSQIGYRLIGKKISEKSVDTVAESPKKEFDFKKYLDELKELADYHDNPQARGYQFERYLNRLFKDCALEPRESFRIKGEQIDGSFVLRNDIYLLEAKWTNKLTEKSDLVVFNEKVSSKSGFTRGLFISFAGYSNDAVETLCNGRKVNIVLMTVQELAVALTREMNISTVIWNKVRALAEEGNYNKLVFEM